MLEWHAGWKPTKGDRVQVVNGPGSGTIVDVDGNRIQVEYDLVASSATPVDVAGDGETGWHDREDLEPIEDTASRVIRDASAE